MRIDFLDGSLKYTSRNYSNLLRRLLTHHLPETGNYVSLIHFLFRNNLHNRRDQVCTTSGKFPNESEAFVTDRWKGNHILHRSASGVIKRIVDHIGCKYSCFVPSCRECQHISNCETIIKEFLRTSVYPGKPTFLLPAHYASIPPSLSHYVWGWCTGTFAHLKTRVWLMNFGWKSEPLSF